MAEPMVEAEQELEFLVRVKTFGKPGEHTLRPAAHALMAALNRTFGVDRVVVLRHVKAQNQDTPSEWKRVIFDPLIREGGELTL